MAFDWTTALLDTPASTLAEPSPTGTAGSFAGARRLQTRLAAFGRTGFLVSLCLGAVLSLLVVVSADVSRVAQIRGTWVGVVLSVVFALLWFIWRRTRPTDRGMPGP